jgi:hypothetical protein
MRLLSANSDSTVPVHADLSVEQINQDADLEKLLSIHALATILCSRHEMMATGDLSRTHMPWPPPTRFVRRNIFQHQPPPGPQNGPKNKDQYPHGPHDFANVESNEK